MSSKAMCQAAHSWVDVGSFHMHLFGVVHVTCGNFHDEQRVCIQFCTSLGKSAMETLTMIQQAFGNKSLSCTHVFQQHIRFKIGSTSVDDDEHTGRPTSCTNPETIARIQQLVRQDQCWTICDIARRWELVMGHANGF